MSASAYLRGNGGAKFFTQSYLAYLETVDVRVINGTRAFALEISKARQLQLFNSLGLRFPKTQVVNCANEILTAALQIGFPLLVKPNIGGRGGGIVRVDSMEQLEAAIGKASFNFGIDQTALVQEFIPAWDSHITRVETLGGKFLYAIDIFTSGRNFNLCPAEICQTESVSESLEDTRGGAPNPGLKVQTCKPPLSIIDEVEKIAAFGGVEYMVDDRDGRIVYYDINALSNFVANALQLLGFDPHARLVDYLEQQKEHV